jgi:tellurite resistance protein TerC
MQGSLFATPLFLVVLVVEWSDLVFAIDSIPAIFAVTRDPFIVYSSNVFAILGLRALYFVLAGAMDKFQYLKPAVAAILVFVGLKMGLSAWVHVPTTISLGVIIGLLGSGVILSLVKGAREPGSQGAGGS